MGSNHNKGNKHSESKGNRSCKKKGNKPSESKGNETSVSKGNEPSTTRGGKVYNKGNTDNTDNNCIASKKWHKKLLIQIAKQNEKVQGKCQKGKKSEEKKQKHQFQAKKQQQIRHSQELPIGQQLKKNLKANEVEQKKQKQPQSQQEEFPSRILAISDIKEQLQKKTSSKILQEQVESKQISLLAHNDTFLADFRKFKPYTVLQVQDKNLILPIQNSTFLLAVSYLYFISQTQNIKKFRQLKKRILDCQFKRYFKGNQLIYELLENNEENFRTLFIKIINEILATGSVFDVLEKFEVDEAVTFGFQCLLLEHLAKEDFEDLSKNQTLLSNVSQFLDLQVHGDLEKIIKWKDTKTGEEVAIEKKEDKYIVSVKKRQYLLEEDKQIQYLKEQSKETKKQ